MQEMHKSGACAPFQMFHCVYTVLFFVLPLINAHADISSGPRSLIFGLGLHLYPYYVTIPGPHCVC